MKLPKELQKYKYEVVEAQKNGHCFIGAICFCLEHDHGMIFMEEDIKRLITYEVYQNNNYYNTFYNDSILCMLRAWDRYIFKGIFTHQVIDITVLAAGKILRVNLCIYKNENGKAILYSQPTYPSSSRDVYLCYSNKHYDSICSMEDSEECGGGFMFNITKEDVDAFALIGASFYVSNPMDLVDGGKLYFVPPKNFNATDSPFAGGETATSSYNLQPVSDRHSSSKQDGITFVPNVEILKNGVQDFNTDIQIDGTEYEEVGDGQNEDRMYDMFADLDLSQMIPDEFQFSEDYSGDEDSVLDNSEDELENVTPLKPQKNRNVHALKSNRIKPRARKELSTETSASPVGIHIDLTNDATHVQSSLMKELPPGSSDDIPIDLMHNEKTFCLPKNPNDILNATVSASNPSQHHFTYDSEPLSSDNTSFLSDSSSSTSHQKPCKFEKVKIDEERMKRVPVKIVDEVPWDINGDCVYKIKCTEENWIQKYEDGCWFQLCYSTRNGLRGHRKTGKCFGSFICQRSECPKLTTEDILNTVDFHQIAKDSYICACCGHPAQRLYCGAIKAVEFHRSTETLTYEHQGDHICQIKPNVRERRKILDTMPIPITGYTKPTKYMEQCMYHYIDQEDYDARFNVSEALCIDDVMAQVKKMRKHPNRSIHQNDELDYFSHVARIQESLLKSDKDKYLVYKWDCHLMGGKASYVFKTSAVSLKIAAMMAGEVKVGGQDSSLCTELAFFDGMHTRVKFFVSLTMWVYHPAMRMMVLLAFMDTPREHSDDIEIFFDTFNKAVGDYLKEPEYIWDPFLIMMDHKGANFEALE